MEKAAATRKFAEAPALFCQIAQPNTDYIIVPRVPFEKHHMYQWDYEQGNYC